MLVPFNPHRPTQPFELASKAQPNHYLRVTRVAGPPVRRIEGEAKEMLETFPCRPYAVHQLKWNRTEPPTLFVVCLQPYVPGQWPRRKLSAVQEEAARQPPPMPQLPPRPNTTEEYIRRNNG